MNELVAAALAYSGERVVPEAMSAADRVYHEHVARYRWACSKLVGLPRPPTVLDAACGSGYGSAMMGELHSELQVFGLDNDPATIDYATRTYGASNVAFFCRPIEKPLAMTVDVVVTFETLEHVTDPEYVARLLVDCLNPGGLLLASTPRRGGGADGSQWHTKEFDRTEFLALFDGLLERVVLYGQELEVGDSAPDDRARIYVLEGWKPCLS